MAYSFPTRRGTALLAGSLAVLGLLTACGDGTAATGGPQKVSGTAAPATGGTTTGPAPATSGSGPSGGGSTAPGRTATAPGSAPAASSGTGSGDRADAAARSTRCHTSELRATVGREDPGAGQENFPLVLTNTSGRTCTVRGYPGAAFTDAGGRQLGADPKRTSGSPVTVTLKPGRSAWAGLTFSNPQVSGARTATPSTLVVTPPDERDPLTVKWTAGQVPVGGNSSSVFLTVLSPGTAP
ncbi:DUF4232 domain-containing protein [Streptomyces sp. NPDC047017]|uniref:DUF4232 domain-containing protein n=1 Tax=Streptomyces sp. NPDC047017 TaxID=3155024 RepID=UPI0033C77AB3